nr:hypothetical protein [uncultured Sphingomonas sp.]
MTLCRVLAATQDDDVTLLRGLIPAGAGDRDDGVDRREPRTVAVPVAAGECAGVELRIGGVRADHVEPGGEQVELRCPWRARERLSPVSANLRDARDHVGVAPAKECGAKCGVGAPGDRYLVNRFDPVDRVEMFLDQRGEIVLRGRQRDDGQYLRKIGVGRGAAEET